MVESPSAVPPRPHRIGPYRVLETLGEGGMGVVYLAEQESPTRRVALKVVKPGMDSGIVLARFEQERDALARMAHPNIATVYAAGLTEHGQPWFAMEYVPGVPLTDYCDQRQLSLRERIALFQQVCDGVQHAHLKGVMHRDLKPGNVLVATASGTPKIIDFGLAKAIDPARARRPQHTLSGQLLGTPEYMSPEQASSAEVDLDLRTDVYSLGVILYELLSGELPFASSELRAAGDEAIRRVIREQEPAKPSTRVSTAGARATTAAAARRLDRRQFAPALRGDLDWITLRAIEKERARRYQSAQDLAADLGRYLRHEPVLAGPPSAAYRLAKFVRRHRLQVGAAAAVLVVALIGGALSFVQYRAAVANARQAQANESRALRSEAEARRTEQIASQRADENAALAAREAKARAEAVALAQSEAESRARLALKVRDYDLLAGVVLYERAVRAEQDLYPAWPTRIAALEGWLRDEAGPLLRMRTDLDATLGGLRAGALPPTAAEIEQDRRAHPDFASAERWRQFADALRRAQQLRAGQAQLLVPQCPAEHQASKALALNNQAWLRVAPTFVDRKTPGQEALGLALAQLAVQRAEAPERGTCLDTLAWAWFANGQDAEAQRAAAAAVEAAVPAARDDLAAARARLQAAIEESDRALAAAEQRAAELAQAVGERRTFRFADASQGFLHDTLTTLRRRLAALANEQHADVERRLRWARSLGALTEAHPNANVSWAAARVAIAKADGVTASRAYAGRGIELRPADVLGLVPIGPNPVTRLWEFYDLRSAWDGAADPAALPIPRHRPDGTIPVDDATGIVLVLLPGGDDVTLGSSEDPASPWFDAARRDDEALRRVRLQPFFLARHELTQGQWRRLWTWNEAEREPSYYRPGRRFRGIEPMTLAHPVENVDWSMCQRLLRRHGMTLPTEAQWEYGCRAGTTGSWSVPQDRLPLAANLADAAARAVGVNWNCEAWDDGHVAHAQVGALAANPFGLHDMHGNVFEWCRDGYRTTATERDGDGLRAEAVDDEGNRPFRGGCFAHPSEMARSARRSGFLATDRNNYLGCRAARPLHADVAGG